MGFDIGAGRERVGKRERARAREREKKDRQADRDIGNALAA